VTSRDQLPQLSDANDPQEGPETARLIALLQSLPDPPIPRDLTERVMAEVRRREARPRLLRVPFRAAFQPGAAVALAAGLACLAVFVGVRGGIVPVGEPRTPELVPSVARPIGVAEAVFDRSPGPVPLVPDPVGLFAGGPPPAAAAGSVAPLVRVNDPVSRRLDRHLNRLLLDPRAFYRQIERHRSSDLLIARMADRAAERGDAIGVALRLRETAPRDPITNRFIEQLFGAVLERSLPKH
jgi:hypothetical protein